MDSHTEELNAYNIIFSQRALVFKFLVNLDLEYAVSWMCLKSEEFFIGKSEIAAQFSQACEIVCNSLSLEILRPLENQKIHHDLEAHIERVLNFESTVKFLYYRILERLSLLCG